MNSRSLINDLIQDIVVTKDGGGRGRGGAALLFADDKEVWRLLFFQQKLNLTRRE